MATDARAQVTVPDTGVLLYDDECGLCSRVVQFVLRHEPAGGTLRFASLRGAFAQRVRAEHPWLKDADSMVWVARRHGGGLVPLVRSEAAIRLAEYLGGAWRLLSFGARLLPALLRDAVYRMVARHRRDVGVACAIPTADQRARFID